MIRNIVFLAAMFACFAPGAAAAQSMEWLLDHPGSTTVPISASIIPVANTNVGLESRVRDYFTSTSVMAEIARCESGFRQFDRYGNVLDGGSGSMMGLFQINTTVHAKYAKSIGMDINTVEGNIAYAKKLYDEEGTDPWLSSFSCWHSAGNSAATTVTTQNKFTSSPNTTIVPINTVLSHDLVLGMISPEVTVLQKMLNASGFKLANDGPGSPGQETDKFGSLTRTALRAYQCAKQIACAGDEHTTGFGMTGIETRAALMAANGNTQTPAIASDVSSGEEKQIAELQSQIAQLSAQLFALRQKIAMQ